MDKKYLVTRNAFYNFLGQIIVISAGFLSTPFIIHKLGNDSYGVLSLLVVVVSYFAILDLGLGSSIIKYISQFHAQNEKEILSKLIGTALTFYISIGLIGAGLIIVFTYLFVPRLLHIPTYLLPLAMSAFYISSFGFLVNMVVTVFNSIPSGLQRMDISNSRNIFLELLTTIGTIVVLILGGGLLTIVLWNIISSLIATVIFLLLIKKILPQVSLLPRFDPEIAKKLIRFGGFKFISNLAGQVVFQLDKLLISFFNPVAAVTFYAIPSLVCQRALGVVHNITDAVFPAISSSQSVDDHDLTIHLYIRMLKIITFFSFPLTALLVICSTNFLTLWLGTEFAQNSSLTLKILSIAYFFAALSAAGVVTADGANKPEIPAFFAAFSAVINLVATLILIPKLGIVGAAWSLLINFVIQVPIFLFIIHQSILKVSNLKVLNQAIIRPVFSGLAAVLIAIIVSSLISNLWLNLFVVTMVFSISYLLINFLIGTFDQYDKLLLVYALKKVNILKS